MDMRQTEQEKPYVYTTALTPSGSSLITPSEGQRLTKLLIHTPHLLIRRIFFTKKPGQLTWKQARGGIMKWSDG